MRDEKTYNGKLMGIGKANEEILFDWLRENNSIRGIIDFREFRLTQRLDVECGIETIDKKIVLAELKADNFISESYKKISNKIVLTGNLCFENNRYNHFIHPDKMFYLGWGWRSPAQKLIIRNPNTNETFVFDFNFLRKRIGNYIAEKGKKTETIIVETDKQKSTLNLLIPMNYLKGIYKKFYVPFEIDFENKLPF